MIINKYLLNHNERYSNQSGKIQSHKNARNIILTFLVYSVATHWCPQMTWLIQLLASWAAASNLVYSGPDGRQQFWLRPESAVRLRVPPGFSTYHQIQTGTQREMQFMPVGQPRGKPGSVSLLLAPNSLLMKISFLLRLHHLETPGDLVKDTQWLLSIYDQVNLPCLDFVSKELVCWNFPLVSTANNQWGFSI